MNINAERGTWNELIADCELRIADLNGELDAPCGLTTQ